jgi:Mg2+/Co2+ transporter CorB
MFVSCWLILLLLALVACSAFFSGSETALMSLNRYRLRHQAKQGEPRAQYIVQMLLRPDRLLGVILLGNTFSNILASAVMTVLSIHYFGQWGVLLGTLVLTVVILIFSEAAPKTLAALYPLALSRRVALPLRILLRLCYPLVWLINLLSNAVLALFGVRMDVETKDPLSADELKTVIDEAEGHIDSHYRDILLRTLDLEDLTIANIMVPKAHVVGLNLSDSPESLLAQVMTAGHAVLPLYRDTMDQIIGLLSMRALLSYLHQHPLTPEALTQLATPVYFVPETALIAKQLLYFQRERRSLGVVVDEYGEVQGLVSLQDILEEIVGDFKLEPQDQQAGVKKDKEGAFIVSGQCLIRDLNRLLGWDLPCDGPKTVGGLIVEEIGTLPKPGVWVRVGAYDLLILSVEANTVENVRLKQRKPEEEVI